MTQTTAPRPPVHGASPAPRPGLRDRLGPLRPWSRQDLAPRPGREEGPRWWVTALVVLGVALVLAAASAVAGASALVSPIAPVAMAVALVFARAVWRRPVVGAVVVAAVAPAMAGLDRGLGVPGLKLSELLVIVAAVVLFLRRPARWRDVNGTDVAVALFALVAAALSLYHVYVGDIDLQGDVFLVTLQPAFLLLSWWAASRGVERPGDVTTVVRWVLLVATVPALLAVLQAFDVPGVRDLLITLTGDAGLVAEPGQVGARATGPFAIWHSLAGYLLLPSVIAVVLLLRGDRRILPRPVVLGVLALVLAAIVLSVTVTLMLWLVVAVVVAATLARRLGRAVVMLAALVLAALLVFPGVLIDRYEAQTTQSETTAALDTGSALNGILPQTVAYRVLVWQRDYFPIVGRVARYGLGTDTPKDVIFDATENQALTFLLRGGVGLLAGAVGAVGALSVRALRHARSPENPARTPALALAGVLAFLPVAAMVWPYLSNAGLSYALFGVAGAALALEPQRRVPRLRRPITVPSPRVQALPDRDLDPAPGAEVAGS